MSRIGIDLGTTNTVAALDDHVLEIGEEGASCVPSAVAFLPNGRVQVGSAARRRRSIDGANTVYSSKRIIGRRFDEAITRAFAERYPFDLVDSGGGRPAFRTRAGLHTPTEIATILLDALRQRMGDLPDIADVVITVPTAFNEAQRDATLEAAASAGFAQVRLIDEPSATTFAYRNDPDVDGTVVVYDLGGGTFDISVVDCSGTMPRVLARSSDPYLGGDDIDHVIADWVANEVLKDHNWDLNNYSEVAIRLVAECERAKIRLSREEETRVDLTEVDPECPIAAEGLVVRRGVMDRLASDLVRRTFVTCDGVLHDAGVRPGDVRAVLLAGGSTHLPIVRQGVEAYFGRGGRSDVEPTAVVARGASLAID